MKLLRSVFALPALFLFMAMPKAFSQQLPYRNASLPVQQRVKDLVSRMTLVEKIKQLDMYRGFEFTPMGDAHEATVYDENMMARALGNFSVGSMHDFYPAYASLSNRVQHYVIAHSRLGIPVLFIEERLHGYSGRGSNRTCRLVEIDSSLRGNDRFYHTITL